MNIWDAVFGASKIVYKPGGTAYVTHVTQAQSGEG